MTTNFDDVGKFHRKFDLPFVGAYCPMCRTTHANKLEQRPGPREVSDDLLEFRERFLIEELTEFQIARDGRDIAGMADALIDLVYVAMGTAHLLGLPWQELWDDVQFANMSKVRATPDPDVPDSARGGVWDVVKPPGWEPPHTGAILERHGFDA